MRNKVVSVILFMGLSQVVCASAPDGVSDGYNWHYTIDVGRMLLTVKDVTPTQNAEVDFDISLDAITSGKYTVVVDDGAFSACKSMRSITLPSHIISITADAFEGCDNLTSIGVKNTTKEISIAAQNGLLLNSEKTKVIACPKGRIAAEIPMGVTDILTHAFKDCKKLEKLDVPLSIERMGSFAFEGCENLKTVYYVGTGSMESSWGSIYFEQKDDEFTYNNPLYYAQEFYTRQTTSGDEKLVTYVYAGREVSRFAYYGCKSLESVVLNKTRVNMWAFAECPKLRSLTIERQDSTVSSSCFYGCTNLTSITLSGNAVLDYSVEDGVLYTADKKKLVLLPASKREYTVPTTLFIPGDGYLKRFEYSFGGCRLLEKLVLPDTANYIMNDFIRDCGAENKFKVYVPASYVQTAQGAFEGCANGTTIIFEGDPPWNSMSHYRCTVWETNVTAIGISAAHFEKWVENAESVLPKCYVEYFDIEYENALQGGVSCIGTTVPSACLDCGISPACIEIPVSRNAVPVKEIGPCAFKEYFKLTTVSLPESLARIGNGAFYMCKELCSMAIPESVISIGADAVYGCDKLVQRTGGAMYLSGWLIDVAGVEGDEFVIPNGVKHLADKSFAAVQNLSVIEIPQSVETIGRDAFRGTKYLNSEDEFVVRDGWLLAYNGSASEITIPSNVRRIADGVFVDNLALERVNIGNGVEYVGSSAFMGCKNLQEVKYDSRSTKMGYDVFNGSASSLQINDLAYYQVRFESNGAGDVQPQNKKSGCAIGVLPEVSKDGSVFLGWYTEADGGELVSESYVINADITLYAHWAIKSYQVVFDANGGMSDNVLFYEHGSLFGNKVASERAGHAFIGWFTSANGGNKIPDDYVVTSEMTVYAHWQINTYTVTFEIEDGVVLTTRRVIYGEKIGELPMGGRTGYRFLGWVTSDMRTVWEGTIITGDVTFYECLEPVECTIKLQGYSHTQTMVRRYGRAIGDMPSDYSRQGYRFLGWYTSNTGGDEITADTLVLGNATYYSHWVIERYHITFDANEGEGGSCLEVEYNTLLSSAAPEVKRFGYEFVGWFTEKDGGECVDALKVFGDTICYAHWQAEPAEPEYKPGYSFACRNKNALEVEIIGFDAGDEKIGHVDIPEVIDGKKVVGIAKEAFSGRSEITSIFVPTTVVSIGEGAFWGCSSLTNMVLPFIGSERGNDGGSPSTFGYIFGSTTYPGSYAIQQPYRAGYYYYVPKMLESVTITDESMVGDSAFYQWMSVKSVKIFPGVTSVGDYAFVKCRALTSVMLPDGVAEIGDYSFSGCDSLIDVTIPKGVRRIGVGALSGCTELKQMTIPEGVEWVAKLAFSGCKGMVSVTIPSTLTSIGEKAFYSCALDVVYVQKDDVERVKGLYAWPSNVKFMEIAALSVEGDAEASVTGDINSGFVVKPSEGKTVVEVKIPQEIDVTKVTIEVSPKVERLKPNGAQVKIVNGSVDITEFLDVPNADGDGVIDLTKVTIKDEIVKEALDVEKGAEIDLNATDPSLTTSNTRKGLLYQLREGATLGGMKDGDSTIGDGKPWSPEITVKGGNSAFYSIGVGVTR